MHVKDDWLSVVGMRNGIPMVVLKIFFTSSERVLPKLVQLYDDNIHYFYISMLNGDCCFRVEFHPVLTHKGLSTYD